MSNDLAKKEKLCDLRERVKQCHACELCEAREHVVFGAGCPDARVMLIGEAPGKNEDACGQPFVGAAGKNLDALLECAGLSREDVYIANVLKCRPPTNRNPRAQEIQACADYLRAQTRIVDPEVIVTLGNFATKFILRTDVGITNLRGCVHMAGKFKVFPVFHPAAALYDRKKNSVLAADFERLGEMLSGARGKGVRDEVASVGAISVNGARDEGANAEGSAR